MLSEWPSGVVPRGGRRDAHEGPWVRPPTASFVGSLDDVVTDTFRVVGYRSFESDSGRQPKQARLCLR